jgi:hypothetical protein
MSPAGHPQVTPGTQPTRRQAELVLSANQLAQLENYVTLCQFISFC